MVTSDNSSWKHTRAITFGAFALMMLAAAGCARNHEATTASVSSRTAAHDTTDPKNIARIEANAVSQRSRTPVVKPAVKRRPANKARPLPERELKTRSPSQSVRPVAPERAVAPAVVPPPAPATPAPVQATPPVSPKQVPAPATPTQPRVLNPVAPPPLPPTATPPTPPAPTPPAAQPPADPLPTEPGPPPPREEPIVAPPNRADKATPQQGSRSVVAGRPGARLQPDAAVSEAKPTALSPRSSGAGAGGDLAVGVAQKIEHALRLMDRGNIIEARIALQSAKNVSPGAAMHALGRTYDPYYLSQIPEIDAGSEVGRAAAYYREALSRGVSAAASDLDRLRANYRVPR